MFLQNKKNTLNVTFYNVIFKTCNHCNINDSQHHQLQNSIFRGIAAKKACYR